MLSFLWFCGHMSSWYPLSSINDCDDRQFCTNQPGHESCGVEAARFLLNNVRGIREDKAGALSVGGQQRVDEGVVHLKSLAKYGKHLVFLSLNYEKHLVDQQLRRCWRSDHKRSGVLGSEHAGDVTSRNYFLGEIGSQEYPFERKSALSCMYSLCILLPGWPWGWVVYVSRQSFDKWWANQNHL